MNQRAILTPILFFLFFAGCAKQAPRTALDASQSAPLQKELDALARGRARIPSLSAFVQVKLSAGGRSELFDAALLAKPPDKLLLQILDDLGQERARFVADGTRVLFFDAQENHYQHFDQDGEALKKTLKLPLSVDDLIDRLIGRLPVEEVTRWEKAVAADGPDPVYWAWRKNDRLGLTQAPLRLKDYEALTSSKNWSYRVRYLEDQMQWSFRRPKMRLTLIFQEFDLAKEIPDGRFNTQPPAGARPQTDR